MTNIRTSEMFPETLAEIHQFPSKESLQALFTLRRQTYRGFAEVEKDKGLLHPEMSLCTPEGQEAVRILVQRGLEELAEAYDSHEKDHYLEELIDAINYFWVLAIIDPSAPLEAMIALIVDQLRSVPHEYNKNSRLSAPQIGKTVIDLNPIFEKLRHRAWMHNPQSRYFDGWIEITDFLAQNLALILDQFKSWQEFVQFYIAKDNVLQFRIKSQY